MSLRGAFSLVVIQKCNKIVLIDQGGYQYQDPLTERARAIAEQRARVQAIKEVHDRERDRLLRGQQELQQHVYGQQLGVSIAYCKTSTPTPIRYKILVRTACYYSNCYYAIGRHIFDHTAETISVKCLALNFF